MAPKPQQNLGRYFECEIREQPALWERLARSDRPARLARAMDGSVVLVGSGSSLSVAQLGALALRRRGVFAHALAATEARLDHNAYLDSVVIAVSQSGASTDLLDALDVLRPRKLIALTNTIDSPLAARAHETIGIGAGLEIAVPASKSVSLSAALLLWAASLFAGDGHRDARALEETAAGVRAWLDGEGIAAAIDAARAIAARTSVAILGSDYGFPIAREAGLKLKEAAYMHAEGFAAGEFRHGSIAMLDATFAAIGIIDDDAYAIVERPMREVVASEALRFTIGTRPVEGASRLGPDVDIPFNTLAWLVTIQTLALFASRARGIDSDRPRGLSKAIVNPA